MPEDAVQTNTFSSDGSTNTLIEIDLMLMFSTVSLKR